MLDFDSRVARDLGLRPHADLMVDTSRDTGWLADETDDGHPAEFRLEWTDAVAHETGHQARHVENGPDVETSFEPRHLLGTFDELPEALAALYRRRERATGTPIELDLSEWAIRYRKAHQ